MPAQTRGARRKSLGLPPKEKQERFDPSSPSKAKTGKKAEGWGAMRWITRENNYRARGRYDKLAEKTDWELYEMAAK